MGHAACRGTDLERASVAGRAIGIGLRSRDRDPCQRVYVGRVGRLAEPDRRLQR